MVTPPGIRDSGPDAYREPRTLTAPSAPTLVDGAVLERDTAVRADACVIGSGAGGAVVAKELAEGGMSVVLLEDGPWVGTEEFSPEVTTAIPQLYRDAGQTVALGRPAIVVPLGRAVGGTTILNSGTCLRPPDAVLAGWAEAPGLEGLGADGLDPCFRRVERELNVSEVPEDLAGRNAAIVREGAEALGWSGGYLHRNSRGCVGTGLCPYGCPSGGKQHAGITYVPKAWSAGARLFTRTRAVRVEIARGGQVTGVRARSAGGARVRVTAPIVVVACGAFSTPALLRRSGIRAQALGRHLTLHPATTMRAAFDDPVGMWDGVPQSYYVDEFADDGVILEGIAGPPAYLAALLEAWGPAHRAAMDAAERTAQFGVLVTDRPSGRVRSVAGHPLATYVLGDRELEAFRRGLRALAEIYRAAGARSVTLPVAGAEPIALSSRRAVAAAIGRVDRRTLRTLAFHPLGTARAGSDPDGSVVDGRLAVHAVAGLRVADGSVLPSSPGVNPMITIMALATRLAFELLGQDPPQGEPEPASRPTVGRRGT